MSCFQDVAGFRRHGRSPEPGGGCRRAGHPDEGNGAGRTGHGEGEAGVGRARGLKGSNWLIAKDLAGNYKLYNVQPGRKAIVDGVAQSLDQLKLGTMLTSTASTTETPVIKRTTTITQDTVFWASPTSIIVTLEGGVNKQYEVPSEFKFDVAGSKLSAMELRPGMKLTGTKIVEEPVTVITHDLVVTGVAPKPSASRHSSNG